MRYRTVQKLLDIAKEKYPEIKTIQKIKEKAIEIQKELFGTLSESSIYAHNVESYNEIIKARNHMAEFGNYPLGMSDCEVVGINGGCGEKCPVFKEESCQNFDYEKDDWK